MNKLTEKEYWDKTYENDSKLSFLPTYNSLDTQIDLELIEIISSYIKGDNVLEIGAGDSNYLIYLSNRFKRRVFLGWTIPKLDVKT